VWRATVCSDSCHVCDIEGSDLLSGSGGIEIEKGGGVIELVLMLKLVL
jgi:hypothetical protein